MKRHRIDLTLPIISLLSIVVACGPEPPIAPPAEPIQDATPSVADGSPCRVWRPLDGGTTASFRGLSVVGDNAVVWVSGTGGTWGRTIDGGATWVMQAVPGAEDLDFRDVDAFSQDTAYLMSAGPGELSRIYKTVDGGMTWDLQFTNPWPEGFFDGMAFWDVDHGLVYGDPVEGRFMVLTTRDGGATWQRVPADGMPPALEAEAGFAASGTGVAVEAGGYAWFGTGGTEARVFRSGDHGQSWQVASTPMLAGESSMGIFSLAFAGADQGLAVGGDYTQPEAAVRHAARSIDGGVTWTLIESSPPSGYRSAVAFAPGSNGRVAIAVGTSGADLSLDGGITWEALGTENYNSVAFGNSVAFSNSVAFGVSGRASICGGWAAGPEGRLGKLKE